MSKNIDDLFKELQKHQKFLNTMQNDLLKEISSIKVFAKNLDKKVSRILEKIEELEVVMEVTEIMEEEEEEEEDEDLYNKEWDPYEDGIDNSIYEENTNDDEEDFN
jgi:DNA anti-recombination protein RmuC